MTPLDLLDALEAFVKRETKDILLPVRVDRKSGEQKERAAEVYKMRLPNKTAETQQMHGTGPFSMRRRREAFSETSQTR